MNALPTLSAVAPAPPAAPTHGAATAADDAPEGGGFAHALEQAQAGRRGGAAKPDAPKDARDAKEAKDLRTRGPRVPTAAPNAAEDEPATARAAEDEEPAADPASLMAGLLAAAPRPPERLQAAAAGRAGNEPAAADGVRGTKARAATAEAKLDGPADAAAPKTERDTAASEPATFQLPQPAAAATAAPAAPAPRPEALSTGADVRVPTHVASPEFAPALGAQVSLLVKDGVHEARLQLNPAEMGPITVQIQVDGSQAQVNFAAEQAFTRERIEQALPALAGALQDAGLTLTGGGVFEQQPRQPQADGGTPGGARVATRGGTPADDGGDAVVAAARAPRRVAGGVDLYA